MPLEGGLPVRPGLAIPEAELEERFSRSAGPGGQHVNTSATKVELRFDVAASSALTEAQKARARSRLRGRMTDDGILIVQAGGERSQLRNRAAARRRMAELLAAALQPSKGRQPTRPTAASRRRRVESKKRRGDLKRLRRPPQW